MDLSPLEEGVPLSPVNPEGLYKEPLKQALKSYKVLKSAQEVIDHNLGVSCASPEQMRLMNLYRRGWAGKQCNDSKRDEME